MIPFAAPDRASSGRRQGTGLNQYSIADALAHRGQPPAPPPPPPRRRRRRWPVVGAVVVAAAGGTAVAVLQPWSRGSDDTSFENPATVELPPPPSSPDATRDYLTGSNGDKLRRVIEISITLETTDTADTCPAAASTLDTIGPPNELFGIADGVPDGPTREIALSHLDELTRYLGMCLQERTRPDAEALTFKRVVFERRLKAVG